MAWTSKRIFKVTDSVSSRISPSVWIYDPIQEPTPAPAVPPSAIEDIQDQIDDIVDSIENEYYTEFVFDKYDYFISTKPFYFHFEIPLGTVEIISARVSFEVKDYRNASLTHSRYAITGDPTDRPVITFYVSEDKGCKFGSAYGPYECDMRAIDILGDLTGEGIKIIKFETDNDVCVTARVFLKLKIDKDETSDSVLTDVFNQRPEVKTLAATSITDVSATLNGDIVKTGTLHLTNRSTGEVVLHNECIKRGFKYATTQADTNDESESGSFVKGTYGLSVTGLTPATDYYFRAYAKNKVGRNYGEYMKFTTLSAIPKIFVAYHDINGKAYIGVYRSDGVIIRTLTIDYIDDWTFYSMCIDSNGNIFFQGTDTAASEKKLYKIDSSGNAIASIACPESENYCGITIGTGGYIYTTDETNYRVNRRNPDTLAIDSYREMVENKTYYGLAFSTATAYVVGNYTDERIEGWDFSTGYVTKRDLALAYIGHAELAVSGSLICGFNRDDDAWTMPLALDADKTDWAIGGIGRINGVGVYENGDFLFLGEEVNNGVQFIARYTTAKVLVWKKEILAVDNYGIEIKAYPF